MKDHAFIVTKPLQLMVALSIINQLEITDRSYVIVVNAFAGAQGVAERLASLKEPLDGISVGYAASIPEAYYLLRDNGLSAIFIDADVGFRKGIDLLKIRLTNSNVRINVYEEGLGTYRTDLYRGLKKKALQAAGIGTQFGGCALTSSLYLYSPNDYISRFPDSRITLELIDPPLAVFIKNNFENFLRLFAYEAPNEVLSSNCNLYLSNWDINSLFVDEFLSLQGDNYIKPHPHIVDFQRSNYGLVIEASAPAEIAILSLLDMYGTVNIYHHGSSVERYINHPKINYFKI